jgi:FtsZ-interacting cell division protein YlmF
MEELFITNIDIINLICQYLSLEDMPSILLVNTEWNKLSHSKYDHWKQKVYSLLYQQYRLRPLRVKPKKVYVQLNIERRRNWKRMQTDSEYVMNRLKQIQQRRITSQMKQKLNALSKIDAKDPHAFNNVGEIMNLLERQYPLYLSTVITCKAVCTIARLVCLYRYSFSEDKSKLLIHYIQILTSSKYNGSLDQFWKNLESWYKLREYNFESDSFIVQYLLPYDRDNNVWTASDGFNNKRILLLSVVAFDRTGLYILIRYYSRNSLYFNERILEDVNDEALQKIFEFFLVGTTRCSKMALNIVTKAIHNLPLSKEHIYRQIEKIAGHILYSSEMTMHIQRRFVPEIPDALYLYCKELFDCNGQADENLKWFVTFPSCVEYKDADGLSALDILTRHCKSVHNGIAILQQAGVPMTQVSSDILSLIEDNRFVNLPN